MNTYDQSLVRLLLTCDLSWMIVLVRVYILTPYLIIPSSDVVGKSQLCFSGIQIQSATKKFDFFSPHTRWPI